MWLRLGLLALIGVFTGSFYVYYTTQPIVSDIVPQAAQVIDNVTFELVAGMKRAEQADVVARAFDTFSAEAFTLTHRSMQWDVVNETVVVHLAESHELSERDMEILATHSESYLRLQPDILEHMYVPGRYELSPESAPQAVAAELLEPLKQQLDESNVHTMLASSSVQALLAYVENEQELLPDLIPLPAQDLGVEIRDGATALVFSTIYYNAGKGNLELRGDPATISTRGDFDRDVFQRIYHEDGTYTDRPAGTFTWHNPHLHYHFADFVTYELTAADGTAITEDEQYLQKSTFCIRDVSRVDIGTATTTDAKYRVCGRERQGITVGWGDAYFFSYPDQSISISDLPSGDYRLTFNVNPEDRFAETTLENNQSWTNFRYTKASSTIEVLQTWPATLPEFEHIYIEQDIW